MSQISAKAVKDLRDSTGAGMMDCKRALADAQGDVERAVELLRERGLAKAGKRGGRATSEGAVSIAIVGDAAAILDLGCETDFVARTDEFIALGDALVQRAVADAGIVDVAALSAAKIGSETVADKVNAAIAKLGENIVVKRVLRLGGAGGVTGGYVHAGGKLAVIVALDTQASGDEVETLAKDIAMHVAAADPSPVAIGRDGVDAALVASERSIFRAQALQSGKPENVVDKIVEGRVNKYLSEICLIEQTYVKDPDRTVGELVRDVAKAAGSEISIAGYQRFKLGEADAGDE